MKKNKNRKASKKRETESTRKKIPRRKYIAIIAGILVCLGIGLGVLFFIQSSTAKSIDLIYEDGNPISAEKIILDGKDLGSVSTGRITIEGLNPGEHQITIVIDGLEYSKSFTYAGESISITISRPVKTNVVVWSKLGRTLSDIKVYSDGELKCATDQDGTCSFMEKTGSHTFRLQGDGLFHQEIKEVTQTATSFTFNVERKFQIQVKANDESTGNPIKDVEISLDGVVKGKASNGELTIRGAGEGSHVIRAEYKDISETLNIEVIKDNQVFEVLLEIPKAIEVKIVDELTNNPVKDGEIRLDGAYKGKTSASGTLEIKDVKEGTHTIDIEYKQISTNEAIDVTSDQRSFTVRIKAPRSVTLKLKDSETGKPIVGYSVLLKNSEIYRSIDDTDDYGRVEIKDVLPGNYKLEVVNAPRDIHARSDPSKLITIGRGSSIDAEVDMPNPKFEGTINCEQKGCIFCDKYGVCDVKLTNVESSNENTIRSEHTLVFLFVFVEEEKGSGDYELKTVGKHILDFGSLSPGESKTKTSENLNEFAWNKEEIVVAVIVEGWTYTPENQKNVGEVKVPTSQLEKLTERVISYCKQNPQVCADVARKIIAGVMVS